MSTNHVARNLRQVIILLWLAKRVSAGEFEQATNALGVFNPEHPVKILVAKGYVELINEDNGVNELVWLQEASLEKALEAAATWIIPNRIKET